jgi:predicted protein tyrosine phosphatase
MLKLLVVCSRNLWRSPTAAAIYRGDPRVSIRSAGLSHNAPHQLSSRDLGWADLLLYMEPEHLAKIKKLFPGEQLPQSINLDIPDDYRYMDPELVEILKQKIEPLLDD